MLLALAFVAVALRVMVPTGFMVRADAGAGFPLIICTGQGELKVLPNAPDHAPDDGDHHAAPCVFAGHGLAAEPPTAPQVQAVAYAVFTPAQPSLQRDLAPGRGLAAPPLPARGPPVLTI